MSNSGDLGQSFEEETGTPLAGDTGVGTTTPQGWTWRGGWNGMGRSYQELDHIIFDYAGYVCIKAHVSSVMTDPLISHHLLWVPVKEWDRWVNHPEDYKWLEDLKERSKEIRARKDMDNVARQDDKVLDLQELIEGGYLQEVNRRFFHPLGLALAVTVNSAGLPFGLFVYDWREDKEGGFFGTKCDEAKAANVYSEAIQRRTARLAVLEAHDFPAKAEGGFVIQPIDMAADLKIVNGLLDAMDGNPND